MEGILFALITYVFLAAMFLLVAFMFRGNNDPDDMYKNKKQ